MINEREIFGWFEALHDHVAQVASPLFDPGKFQLTAVHPITGHAIFPRFAIGDVKGMVDAAVNCARLGYNVWTQGRTIRSDLDPRTSPNLADTVWVFALVVDFDGYGNLLGLPESFVVQTSKGHEHRWYLTCALPLDQALTLSPRFKAEAGADSDTGVIAQDYRVPGTPNFPTPKKIADGRTTEPTFVSRWAGHHFSFAQLNERLPALPPSQILAPTCLSGTSSMTIAELDAKFRGGSRKGPIWLADPTGRCCPKANGQPDRSNQFVQVCWQAFRAGLSPDDVYNLVLAKYRHGCAVNFFEKSEDGAAFMHAEIAKSHAKFLARGHLVHGKGLSAPLVVFGGSLARETGGV